MPVKIFFCYAHEDEPILNKLKAHLRPLQRQGLIDVWHDRDINAGAEWEHEISEHLNSAQVILLLVSPDFMNSEYCYSIEMKKAIEKHDRKEARVIPIILDYVYWQIESLKELQVLPTDAKPVMSASWHSQNEALYDVVEGIRNVVEKLIVEVQKAEVERQLKVKEEQERKEQLRKTREDQERKAEEEQARIAQIAIRNQRSKFLNLNAAGRTDTGKQREKNEDCTYRQIQSWEDGDRGLFIVADGMGGDQAGEVGSKLAVDMIKDALRSFFVPVYEQKTIKMQFKEEKDDTIKMIPDGISEPMVKTEQIKGAKSQKKLNIFDAPESHSIEEQLIEAIRKANKAILRYGEQHSDTRGIGCTVTTALVLNNKAYIANVGDCRTYLLRNGELKSVTRDHSLVARLVEAKQIEPEEVYSHPQRNLVYRSLGAGHKNIDVDVFHLELQADDTLLLCSDGLWEMVRDENLKKVLSTPTSLQKICDTLIDLANANGGEDNISAVVVLVSSR